MNSAGSDTYRPPVYAECVSKEGLADTDKLALFILAEIDRRLDEPGKTLRSLTQPDGELGITRSQINTARQNAVARRTPIGGFGPETVNKVARAMFGGSAAKLFAAVDRWWKEEGERAWFNPPRAAELVDLLDRVSGLRDWIVKSDLAQVELSEFLQRVDSNYVRKGEEPDFDAVLRGMRRPGRGPRQDRKALDAEQGPVRKKTTFER